jgi:hypothetical protein
VSELATATEALRCFRPIDRDDVEGLEKLPFPLRVDDCYAWTSGPRSYLVFCASPEEPARGIVFHRSTQALPDVASMCEWCHVVRAHGGVKLLSAYTDARHSVGLWLCSDLGCLRRARELPGPDDIRESGDTDDRIRRIVRRIADFAARRL